MTTTSEYWPYSGKNSVDTDPAVARLFNAPELSLSTVDQIQLSEFAHGLNTGIMAEGLRVDSSKTLEEVSRILSYKQEICDAYYETGEGRAAIRDLLPDLSLERSASVGLCELIAHGQDIPTSVAKRIAFLGTHWRKDQLRQRLQEPRSRDAEQPDIDVVTVNFRPDLLLQKIRHIQAYRQFYNTVRRDISSAPQADLNVARKVIVDLYLARANSMLTALYPGAAQLARQIDMSPATPAVQKWREGLAAVAPVVTNAWRQTPEKHAFAARFAERLDRLRNGVGRDRLGKIAVISTELDAFAGSVEAAQASTVEAPVETAPYKDRVESLQAVRWNASEMKVFLEDVLVEWDLLSAHTTDWETASERSVSAPDHKWQVVISPKASSLGVTNANKTMYIPEKFARKLLVDGKSGCLPVAAHELTHVLQAEADETVARTIPLAKIRGRQSLTIREMGGVYQEEQLLGQFGLHRDVKTSYVRALQVKLMGGNQTQVSRGFADGYNASTKSSRGSSVADAALRLYRMGGFDSQPLDYLEQSTIADTLKQHLNDEQITAFSIAGASFSLHDAAALHAVGLFEVPRSVPRYPAYDVLRIFFDRYDRV